MPLRLLAAAALFPLLALSCDRSPRRLDPVPKDLEPAVARGRAAIADLKGTLSGRLASAMKGGGPKAGIEVCSSEAQQLTQQVATRHRVRIGRTSHRLRNPKTNEPRPWLTDYLSEVAGKKAAAVKPALFDLGSSVGWVEPLGTLPLCQTCHGDPASLSPEVKASLAARYPQDQATGFAEGDVRGVVWVELDK